MKRWHKVYREEINSIGGADKFIRFKAREKKELITRVLSYASRDGPILEAGCGTGANSSYIASLGYKVVALDADQKMLRLAKDIASHLDNKPRFVKGNIMNLKYSDQYFDVSFSHGVLEHFSDCEIIHALNEQLRVAKMVILSVPSSFFSDKDRIFGDERFLSVPEWEKLLVKANGKLIKKFGYYFQDPLSAFINKLFDNSMISRAPYIGFILRSGS